MCFRKRSNTYWSTKTFAPSVVICIARIICHRLSAAICIGRPLCLCSSVAICIDQSICPRWRAAIYVLVNQYVIQNRQQYALITLICHQVQYDLQNILKFISYCPRYDFFPMGFCFVTTGWILEIYVRIQPIEVHATLDQFDLYFNLIWVDYLPSVVTPSDVHRPWCFPHFLLWRHRSVKHLAGAQAQGERNPVSTIHFSGNLDG